MLGVRGTPDSVMKEHMFDQSETAEGKDRSRLIIALSGIAVLLVAALIIIVASRPSAQTLAEQEWPGPGTVEFDSYSPNIAITDINKSTTTTLIGRRLAWIKATITNNSDRTVIGLKIKASAVGFGGETLVFRMASPIPHQRETLAPGEFARIEIQIEAIPPPAEIQDFTLQITALRLK
jgi:hypothetical protein